MKQVDNEAGFIYWMSKARPGEKAVYYDGFLMMDRERFLNAGGTVDMFPQAIKAARVAWKAYMDGRVVLVQKKKDACSYEYIAVRT